MTPVLVKVLCFDRLALYELLCQRARGLEVQLAVCVSVHQVDRAKQGSAPGVRKRRKLQLPGGEGRLGGRRSDVTAARRFRSPAPERMTAPSVGRELGLLRRQGAHDRAAPASESASTSVPPAPGTMATDSWALAVDEQEAAAESVSWLQA